MMEEKRELTLDEMNKASGGVIQDSVITKMCPYCKRWYTNNIEARRMEYDEHVLICDKRDQQ
jgi:hypothetical protein